MTSEHKAEASAATASLATAPTKPVTASTPLPEVDSRYLISYQVVVHATHSDGTTKLVFKSEPTLHDVNIAKQKSGSAVAAGASSSAGNGGVAAASDDLVKHSQYIKSVLQEQYQSILSEIKTIVSKQNPLIIPESLTAHFVSCPSIVKL